METNTDQTKKVVKTKLTCNEVAQRSGKFFGLSFTSNNAAKSEMETMPDDMVVNHVEDAAGFFEPDAEYNVYNMFRLPIMFQPAAMPLVPKP